MSAPDKATKSSVRELVSPEEAFNTLHASDGWLGINGVSSEIRPACAQPLSLWNVWSQISLISP